MTMREIKNELMSLNKDHLEVLYRNLSHTDGSLLANYSILATQHDLDKETKIDLISKNITEPSDFCKKVNESLKDVNARLFLAEGSSNEEDIRKLRSVLNKISDSGSPKDKENIADLTQQLGKLAGYNENPTIPRKQ